MDNCGTQEGFIRIEMTTMHSISVHAYLFFHKFWIQSRAIACIRVMSSKRIHGKRLLICIDLSIWKYMAKKIIMIWWISLRFIFNDQMNSGNYKLRLLFRFQHLLNVNLRLVLWDMSIIVPQTLFLGIWRQAKWIVIQYNRSVQNLWA